MKKLIALNFLIWLMAASVAAQSGDLYISISLVVASHSKDSSSTKTSYTIAGRKVVYEETYSGYRAGNRPPLHKEYSLTEHEVADLKHLIEQKRLLKSRSLISPFESGPGTSYDLTEEIKWQGQRSLIKVSGPLKSLTADEAGNNQLYQDADALLQYVRAAVNLKGDRQ